jgi:hypothetical protein
VIIPATKLLYSLSYYWILGDIFLRCYSLRILILYFILSSSCIQPTLLIQKEYCVSVYLFRRFYLYRSSYDDYNFPYVMVVLDVFPDRWISIFCVRFSLLIFLLFICVISWITKSILRLYDKANILSMLLIMLLSHVEIHICHF